MQRSLVAIVLMYLGLAVFVPLASDMSVRSALLLAVLTAVPALVLSSVSRVAAHAAAWASVCMFAWSVLSEAFPAGGGAPMTLVPIVLFGWPSCIVIGASAAGIARMCSSQRRSGEPLQ